MAQITNVSGFDVEALINNVATDYAKGDLDDKRVSKARIHAQTEKIRDKRQERIENLKDQMKEVSNGGGGCFKFLKAIFTIFDILLKPLSLLSMGQLRVELSKTLDMLKDAKNQKALLNLNMNGQNILKALEGLKKLLGDDMNRLKDQDEQGAKETNRILHIIEDIQDTFKATNKV